MSSQPLANSQSGLLDDTEVETSNDLTMFHSNPARIAGNRIRVDRKFHVGMLKYCQSIAARIVSVHPEATDGPEPMDTIDVPLTALPYGVLVVNDDPRSQSGFAQREALDRQLARSAIVYGMGLGCEALARSRGLPYIMTMECDLMTQATISRTQVKSSLRKLSRTLRTTWNYYRRTLPDARGATAIHCNGYPVYDAMDSVTPSRLLYLDSRMTSDMVISESTLASRLAARSQRPLKLLYSGRYEPLKGAADAVKVAICAAKLGVDIEMHCYGSGSQAQAMRQLVNGASMTGQIHVHDAVTYPELVELAREFDVFVCCHIQSDPSCTYVESFGAGLPIVGYGNRMWRRLCEASKAGMWSKNRNPELVARDLQRLANDPTLHETMSSNARAFALEHCFENEFAKRTGALNEALRSATSR